MSGRRIGSYELLELLGEGGIGQVYAARDTELGRHVAIKMLRRELSRDHSFLSRFHNEARSLGNLNHQNITILYTFQLEGPNPFMVMELVRGETLEALLSRVRRLPLRESLAVVAQAVAGLAYAHRNGVIHRDIKPSNLMIAESGLLKIMDFGIARVRGSQRLTRAGQMFATLLYASPEQIKGNDVDERSDLYSLGVVLYEMIAGSPPFTAENDHALMTAHLETPPPPLAARVQSLDAQIEAAVLRALAKRPEDRFASVEEFGRAVGAAAFRGDSSDILQQFATTSWRGAAPRTRVAEAANSDTEIWDDAGGDGVGGSPKAEIPRRRVAPNRPKGPPAGMRLPVAILGGVVIALALGLGYVVLWSRAPTETHLAAIEPPKPMPYAAPAPTPPAPTPARNRGGGTAEAGARTRAAGEPAALATVDAGAGGVSAARLAAGRAAAGAGETFTASTAAADAATRGLAPRGAADCARAVATGEARHRGPSNRRAERQHGQGRRQLAGALRDHRPSQGSKLGIDSP